MGKDIDMEMLRLFKDVSPWILSVLSGGMLILYAYTVFSRKNGKHYSYYSKILDNHEQQIRTHDNRLDAIEQSLAVVTNTTDRLDKKMGQIEKSIQKQIELTLILSERFKNFIDRFNEVKKI